MDLRAIIRKAEEDKKAIPHFNVSTLDALTSLLSVAREEKSPIVIGVSEGERDFFGEGIFPEVIKTLREETGHPIFSNADHTYSVLRAKKAIDLGYDAVIFDGAKLSLEENIRQTKEVVAYAREKNPNVLVEGELGYIGTSSNLLEKIPEGVSLEHLTTPEDAKRFVEETGVDLFSPSVGNIHGVLKHAPNPRLHIDRIKEIHAAVSVPLVLHGGSGISDSDFKQAIEAGISTIHINTEIRLAYKEGIEKHLKENPDDIAPYKFLKEGDDEMKEVVRARTRLFQGNA